MSVVAAWRDGLGRVRRAPWLVAGVWLSTVLVALPLALALRGMLAAHLGSSLAADTAADGLNFDWWNEFLSQAAGLGQSFLPGILGFAAVLQNLSGVADAEALSTPIGLAVAAYLVASAFLAGGILDRLARDRVTGSRGFFAACGVFFFRFVRLWIVAYLVYYLLFTTLHPWIFGTVYEAWTRNLTVERTAFFCRLLLYIVFGALVLAINMTFDYAKIRAVVEDRRSMLGALGAGLRFVRRNPGGTLGLYLMNLALFLLVILAYAAAAPGAWSSWLAFLVGQLYIVLRVVVRLQFASSQIAFFQGRLAHAGYVAAPAPVWPDSPAAEAIRPA